MAKTAKVTAKKIMDKNNGAWIAPLTYDYVGFTVEVKPYVGFEDAMDEITALISTCAPDDGSVYYPQALDFGFRLWAVEQFTNIELPATNEERYSLVYGTNIFDRLVEDRPQISGLWKIVEEIAKYNTGNIAHRVTKTITDSVDRIVELAENGDFKTVLDEIANNKNIIAANTRV